MTSLADDSSAPAGATGDTVATAQGFAALLLWAALASLTALAGPIPPFQLAAMTFAVGTLVGLGWALVTRTGAEGFARVPWRALALGVYGLFVFHACYFFALQTAPPLEASLIIYLWPLLIVVFAGFLPARVGGERLRWPHVAGALLGFAGTVLILVGQSGSPGFAGQAIGYLLAAAAALVWASYSVATRLFQGVPIHGVIASCAITAVASLIVHLAIEPTVWPASATAWLAVAGLGIGPVGLAFYLWDGAMKRGRMQVLGVASYATPLLSTGLLTALGLAPSSRTVWIAAALVTAGAALAAWKK